MIDGNNMMEQEILKMFFYVINELTYSRSNHVHSHQNKEV